MKGKIEQVLATIPTALAGLALAIASLGWSWENAFNFQGKMQIGGALVAGLLLCILLFKFFLTPAELKQDLAHYLKGSMVPTFAMTTMVIANSVNYFNHQVSILLWLTAIIFHLFFLFVFIYYRVQDFKFEQMLPSWFIPPIGVVVATISLPEGEWGANLVSIANISLLFGLIAYGILLPILLYRCFMHSNLLESEQPTIAIFATPASLILVGYLAVIEEPNYFVVTFLAALAVSMTVFIYYYFNKLLRLPFSPAYAAFTFPLVMGATAMFKMSHFLLVYGSEAWIVGTVQNIAYLELVLASLMVGYVSFRYTGYFKLSKSRCAL